VWFKTVYPSTIAYLLLTKTTRMTHFEDTCFVILTTEMAGTRGTYGEEKKRILSFGWVT